MNCVDPIARIVYNLTLLCWTFLLSVHFSAVSAQTGATSAEAERLVVGEGAWTESRHFRLDTLAKGVYAAIHNDSGGYAICNAGIVDLGDQTLIFDPFLTPEAARDLRKVAEQITGRPVSLVVNSHFHNDHVRGNQVFVPGSVIISTSWTRTAIAASEPEEIRYEQQNAPKRLAEFEGQWKVAPLEERHELLMWIGYYRGMTASHPELKLTLPTLTFDGTLVVHGSARTVELRGVGKGHTESDLVLYLPGEHILFAGDLLFVERHPWFGDGFPLEWVAALRTAYGWNIEAVVPGHGPVSKPGVLLAMAEYIETLSAITKACYAAGQSEDEVAATPVPVQFKHWFYSRFHPWNIRALYKSTAHAVKSNGR